MTKIFYSAQDVADLIGVSVSKAYQIIAQMNSELKEKLKCDERAKDRIFELSYKIHMPEESIRRLRAEKRRSKFIEQII